MVYRKAIAMAIALLWLGGCAMLPASGPQSGNIRTAAVSTTRLDTTAFKYVLVDVSAHVLASLSDIGPGSLYRTFGAGRGAPAEINVGVGDSIQLTIFESASGGLFIPSDAGARPGNFVAMPTQTVDQAGVISVPYAGEIRARGRSLLSIQQEAEEKLRSRAIEPRVIVSVTNQVSNQVTVIGQVSAASKVNISPAGDRILDVLSKAGGIVTAGYETFVTLQRKDTKATIYFGNLINNAEENIFVQPDDIIYVYLQKRSFSAFGASGNINQFSFEQEHLMLSDAVARSGGVLDSAADPGHVFLYRLERRHRLKGMNVDLRMFPRGQDIIPTVYRFNLRDPAGFFVARKFYVQDHDVLYVANADKVELFKFLELVNGVTGAVANVTSNAVTTYAGTKSFR
jgi:polysaccharide biosynthesis/export protein